MHIADGILTWYWCLIWYLLAAIFVAIGSIQTTRKRKADPKYMSLVGLMGAAVLVISVWHIPVPITGSCSHPVGTPLAAMIIGPFPVTVISAIALFFQTFVGHGGITTIGANDMSMGIAGTFAGFGIFMLLYKAKVKLWAAAGIGGLVGDLMTYIVAAFELAISITPNPLIRMVGHIHCWVICLRKFRLQSGVWLHGCSYPVHRKP